MEHDQIRELIHPYVDGELDIVNARFVAEHLPTCEGCRTIEQDARSLRDILKNAAPAFRAPDHLRRDVRRAIRAEAAAERRISFPWFSLAASAVCGVLVLGFIIFQNYSTPNHAIANEVVADHIRSLLATHLVDVASSDQHTVKPWFNGKIDFAPEVKDFAAQGFPLVGGRLDYLDGKTVVALVYRHNQHPINVLIAPASGRHDAAPTRLTRRGYNLVHWTRGEMDYWAVSDLNAAELGQFSTSFGQ
ncbi:MAG TPA: anti-sigma factor [Chthoniobacterales bacterium]